MKASRAQYRPIFRYQGWGCRYEQLRVQTVKGLPVQQLGGLSSISMRIYAAWHLVPNNLSSIRIHRYTVEVGAKNTRVVTSWRVHVLRRQNVRMMHYRAGILQILDFTLSSRSSQERRGLYISKNHTVRCLERHHVHQYFVCCGMVYRG